MPRPAAAQQHSKLIGFQLRHHLRHPHRQDRQGRKQRVEHHHLQQGCADQGHLPDVL
jgi:hypothetical protein